MKILVDEFGINSLLAYWPLSLELSQECVLFENRKDFILIGSFLHPLTWMQCVGVRRKFGRLFASNCQKLNYTVMALTERGLTELRAKNGFYFKGRTKMPGRP